MAAEEKTIIVDIQVEGEFDQQIGTVNSAIDKNRKAIRDLSKDYEANATTIASLEGTNKKLAASKRDLTKENDIQKGSLSQLRNELSKQVRARNDLNIKTKEGRERFNEMNVSIKGLNEEISGFEQAGGDFRRNVGNYPQLLGNAVGGISIFGTSLGSLFTLIATNPVGLLLTAITGLVAVFAKSQSGAEFFRKAGAALGATLGLLSDIVEALGNALISAFEDPQQVLDDLVQNIIDGVVFYFDEFIPNAIQKVIDGFGLLGTAAKQLFEGDFDAALETGTEAALLLVDGITDLNPATAIMKTAFEAAVPALTQFIEEANTASDAAFRLETQLIANEKALADLRVSQAQSIAEQKELNRVIEDTTKTFEERIEAAEEFGRVEAEQIAESIRLQQERIRILEAQNALTNSTEEDIQRVRDAQIELANLQAASDERAVTNANKLNTIRNQIDAEETAARAARFKDIDEKAKAIQDAFLAADAEQVRTIQTQQRLREQTAARNLQLGQTALGNISSLAGDASAIGKAAALTQIGIDTAKAISGGTAAAQSVPFPGNLLAIITTITTVLANIATAKSILSSADSGGGSVAPTAPAVPANIGQSVNAQLLSQFTGPAQQGQQTAQAAASAVNNLPPQQVAVVDIITAIDARGVTVEESTIG